MTAVLFDTDCVLCSGFVHFVLRHERDTALRFVNAWSEAGLRLAAEHGYDRADLNDSYLVITDEGAYVRSDAGFIILRHLKAPFRWLAILKILPRAWRDAFYDLIARNRYDWFGRKEQCFLPPPEQRHRFIDDVRGEVTRPLASDEITAAP